MKDEYLGMLEQLAKEENVDMRIVAHRVARSGRGTRRVRKFTRCGISIKCRFCYLPSIYEGFGECSARSDLFSEACFN